MSLQPTPQNMGRSLFPLVASKFIGNRFASPTTNDRFCGSTGSKRWSTGYLSSAAQLGSKIEGSITAELGGTARLTFAPEGLHCENCAVGKASADFRASVED